MEREDLRNPSFIIRSSANVQRGPPCSGPLLNLSADRLSSLHAFDTHRSLALEVGNRLVDHVHPIDGALPTSQVHRRSVPTLPEEVAGRKIVRLPVGINNGYPQHFNISTSGVQADRLEAAFAATDTHRVAVLAEEGHLLT